MIGTRSRRCAGAAVVALCLASTSQVVAVRVAGASGAPPAVSMTPGGPLKNGQSVAVGVGPNGYFTPNTGVKILECADPGGSSANLPKDDTACDGNTVQAGTLLVGDDGSFSVDAYPVYLLPSSALGEPSDSIPICNQTHYCVLYVGQDQNDFSKPRAFSAPFLVTPASGATSTSTGAAGGTGAAATATTGTNTTAPPATSGAERVRVALGRILVGDHRFGCAGRHRCSARHRMGGHDGGRAHRHRCARAPRRRPEGAVSTLTSEPTMTSPVVYDDVPINLMRKPVGADRVFNSVLAGASAIVLVLMVAVVVFLCKYGFAALREAGFGLVTDPAWSPDSHHFGMLSLLGGTVAIALIAVLIAIPTSLSLALMINEYAPRPLKPWLTAVVDMLATVPSIVYGFWGLQLVSGLQAAPAKWLVAHASFVPIFRTPSPGSYVKSIFACGLICSVTIIPIITSVSREVMAQAPRDTCEAALGLGATRWGMVTDVILPFSRNGILGAILLGVGRGLGETMIVVLVLSQANHFTSAMLGPGGLGSIPKQITDYFTTSSPIGKSALILLGLVLFVTTLMINIVARLVVERSDGGVR